MDVDQIRNQLTSFVKNVSQRIKVDEVIIFGSYAKNTATKKSDIDVIVVSEDFKGVRSDKRLRILDRAAAFLRPEIVAAGFTEAEMKKASQFSLMGQAREAGVRFL